MIVVSDTSVLCYLSILDLTDILKRRFKRVSIPREVVTEATFPRTPAPLQALLQSLPEWLTVESAPPLDLPALTRLDRGEVRLGEDRLQAETSGASPLFAEGSLWIPDCFWSAPAERRDQIEPQRRGFLTGVAGSLGVGFLTRRGDGAFP